MHITLDSEYDVCEFFNFLAVKMFPIRIHDLIQDFEMGFLIFKLLHNLLRCGYYFWYFLYFLRILVTDFTAFLRNIKIILFYFISVLFLRLIL